MKKRFTFRLLFLILFFVEISISGIHAQDEFEIVESVPLETILEQSDLSRTQDVWLKMINDSKQSIDIEVFYFASKKDEPMERIMSALKDAASRGVMIRIIVDSSFYVNSDKSVDELEGIPNIQIKKFPMANVAGGVMHAKYFIVDGENLFIGSQNMDWRALIHIHEMGARVKDKNLARTFHEVFETDWKLCDGNYYGLTNQAINFFVTASNPVTINTSQYGDIILYPAFSPPKINMQGLSVEEDELLNIIKSCKDSLLIQMYSYTSKARNETNYYGTLDSALRQAASRGVKIKIIFSDWAIKDVATDFIKSLSTISNIQVKFSSIPQYSGGYIPFSRVEHCKYFTADDNISWISTANWEWGYFYNTRNATLIINNRKVNEKLSTVFLRDWDGPYTNFVDINKKYESVKRN